MMGFWRGAGVCASTKRQPRLLLLAVLLLGGCSPDDAYQHISGSTMGTYFTVTCQCSGESSEGELSARIESELETVNAQMSTYDPASALSLFNNGPVNEWVSVDPELAAVVDSARSLSEQSDGAFDVTVGPLVNAWGFGPQNGTGEQQLSALQLAALLENVGYQLLEVTTKPPALRKTAEIYVDLSAIAKGHGVDRLAGVLQRAGCANYLVDIGGEVRVRGVNARGRLWRIGIEVPDPEAQGGVQRILRLDNQSVATSGDYRNFRQIEGRRISHTIDPRTGQPVAHHLASVTVVHPSAMWADGYATAINVLGPDQGLALGQSLGLAALLIIRTPDGYQERYTASMSELIAQP